MAFVRSASISATIAARSFSSDSRRAKSSATRSVVPLTGVVHDVALSTKESISFYSKARRSLGTRDRRRRMRPGEHRLLQPRGLGQIDAEAVAPALIAPGHFGAGVAELLLHVAFVDFRRGGEAGAQRMAGEFRARSPSLRSPRTPAARAVALTSRATCLSVSRSAPTPLVGAGDAAKQRAMAMRRELQPGLQRGDGAGGFAGAAADLDLAPAGLAAQRSATQRPCRRGSSIQPEPSSVCSGPQSRPTISERRKPPAKPISEDGAVAQAAQIANSRVASIASRSSGSTASFCTGGRRVGAADAGEDGDDVSVLAVKLSPSWRKPQLSADSRRSMRRNRVRPCGRRSRPQRRRR